MAVIDIGDGRVVPFVEGALRVPPPPPPVPKVKKPWKAPKKDGRNRSVVIRGMKFKCDPRPADRKNKTNGAHLNKPNETPGFMEWLSRRAAQLLAVSAQGRALGHAHGMTRKKADAIWAVARRKAKKDVENIKKTMDLGEAATEALTSTIETMRSPLNQQIKLAAAKLVLEYTMAKPAAKSEVTLNAAEKWLSEIGQNAD